MINYFLGDFVYMGAVEKKPLRCPCAYESSLPGYYSLTFQNTTAGYKMIQVQILS